MDYSLICDTFLCITAYTLHFPTLTYSGAHNRPGVPETEKDSKPRSLRFTWSMKTTSTLDPKDMMKEIRKVSVVGFIWIETLIC